MLTDKHVPQAAGCSLVYGRHIRQPSDNWPKEVTACTTFESRQTTTPVEPPTSEFLQHMTVGEQLLGFRKNGAFDGVRSGPEFSTVRPNITMSSSSVLSTYSYFLRHSPKRSRPEPAGDTCNAVSGAYARPQRAKGKSASKCQNNMSPA